MTIFDQHPTPWACDEVLVLRDANGTEIKPAHLYAWREIICSCVNACKGKPEVVERLIAEIHLLATVPSLIIDRGSGDEEIPNSIDDLLSIYRELEGK